MITVESPLKISTDESLAKELAESKHAKKINRATVRKNFKPSLLISSFLESDPITLLHPGEFGTYVAKPGSGKTQLAEAIACAGLVNMHGLTQVDTLGFTFQDDAKRNVLYIDTERPSDGNLTSYNRIEDRLNIDDFPGLIKENDIIGLDYYAFVDLKSAKDCREELDHLLEEGNYGQIGRAHV